MSVQPVSSLPKPFTALVGRAGDIAAIARLLEQSTGSVLTLVGPAGVGKTRLAIAAAEAVADRFPDGVAYVDLAAVADARQVLSVLVSALGIPDGEGAPGRMARFLADRSMLLVIDNFEQVCDAAPLLNSVVAGARGVRTLVTSQTALRVQGEREYAVEPLPLPNPAEPLPRSEEAIQAILASPAVDLFVRRAQTARPGFTLTPANIAAVCEICRQLDGLPLAIELAAARSNVLTPEALLTRLSAPLNLLRGGPRDAPDRHQALHSAIEWSYSLLTPDEACLLERLAVFAGTFTLAAAEAVAGNDPIEFAPSFYADQIDLPRNDPPLETSALFDLMDALVDHNLVQRVAQDEDEPRFRLFTTIRQFAREKLRARGGEDTIALRHATWFRARAEAVWTPGGISVLEWSWLGPLEHDIDNFRSAIDWLSETDPALASTFVSALGWHFYFFGRRNEGVRALERTDGCFDPSTLSPVNRARNHYIRGVLVSQISGREREAATHFEAMLAECEAIGLPWAVGFALLSLGVMAEDAGEYERALEFFYRARPLLELVDDLATTANVDVHIASALFGLGRIAEARALAEPIAVMHPDAAGANFAYSLRLLGVIQIVEGDLANAAKLIRAYLDAALEYHMGRISTEAVDATATIVVHTGEMELGARLFGTADRLNLDADYVVRFPERPLYTAARDAAKAALGDAHFSGLYRSGYEVGFTPAIASVREILDVIAAGGTPITSIPEHSTNEHAPVLTRRELEVLQLVSVGMTDREIADRLFISPRTTRTHVSNILGKLGVPSRSAATSYALRHGLVQLDDIPR